MPLIATWSTRTVGLVRFWTVRTKCVCTGSAELKGRDAWERGQADMMCEAIGDAFDKLHDWFYAKDDEERKVRLLICSSHLTNTLYNTGEAGQGVRRGCRQRLGARHGEASGCEWWRVVPRSSMLWLKRKDAHVNCVQMLYADIFIACCVYCLCIMGFEGILVDTPKLKAHMERVKVRGALLIHMKKRLK